MTMGAYSDEGPAEGRQQIERGMRQQARRLRESLAQRDVTIAALQREIETLTALNKSQAERIEKLLGDLAAIKKETS